MSYLLAFGVVWFVVWTYRCWQRATAWDRLSEWERYRIRYAIIRAEKIAETAYHDCD